MKNEWQLLPGFSQSPPPPQVEEINNTAAELSQNATAQADLIRAKASADAQAIVENAHNAGLQLMYGRLNITAQEEKASLNYLRTLRDHQDVYMTINFNSLVNTAGFPWIDLSFFSVSSHCLISN